MKFSQDVTERVNERGNHVVMGLRIFRTGTFTDMYGMEHTWDDSHLSLMVLHFALLKDSGIFPDVPVREDHSMSVSKVVGYYEKVYLDPTDPSFLCADIEFTEPDAYGKWQRRTWRARSIEIGMYETNDHRSYFPTVLGLAFVDIPAVEGLHSRQRGPFQFHQAVLDNEETQMHKSAEEWAKDPEGWTAAAVYAHWLQSANYAQALQDWERGAIYAKALEDEAARQNPPAPEPPTPGITPPVAPHAAPPAPPAPAPAPAPAPTMFRINGTEQVSDFARIQTHIDTLEEFRRETTATYRADFVAQLAKDNKIAAPQIEMLTEHAKSLNDEQFANFRASYENAPSLSMFGQQAQQETAPGNPGTGSGTPTPEDQLAIAEETVAQHRRAGMAEEKVVKTASYAKLVAAGRVPAPTSTSN